MTESKAKLAGRWLLTAMFVYIGVEHFVNTAKFVAIMPPWIPLHEAMVYVSGVFEILGGLAILHSKTRRLAGWGLLALLAAVFPANIHMAINEVYIEGMPEQPLLLWLRLPFQLVFAVWVAWAANIWPKPKA